jgi:hypothetical protein
MDWTEFIRQQAQAQGLSFDETITVLVAFPDSNQCRSILDIANNEQISISENVVKLRFKSIYQKFIKVCPELSKRYGYGKLKCFHQYLQKTYLKL